MLSQWVRAGRAHLIFFRTRVLGYLQLFRLRVAVLSIPGPGP